MSDVRPPQYTLQPANSGGYQHGQPAPSAGPATTRRAINIHDILAEILEARTVDEDDGVTGSKQGYVTPKIPREYMRLDFENCFQDHSTTRVIPVINRALATSFMTIKLVMYNVLAVAIGFPIAILWAFIFAVFAFVCTYLYSPVLRLTLMAIHVTMPLYTETTRSLFYPLGDALGRMFRQIQIKTSLDGGLNIQKNSTTRPAQNV